MKKHVLLFEEYTEPNIAMDVVKPTMLDPILAMQQLKQTIDIVSFLIDNEYISKELGEIAGGKEQEAIDAVKTKFNTDITDNIPDLYTVDTMCNTYIENMKA